jgi:hypothetical protein
MGQIIRAQPASPDIPEQQSPIILHPFQFGAIVNQRKRGWRHAMRVGDDIRKISPYSLQRQ